jgi:predicted nucleic acid-binding protein
MRKIIVDTKIIFSCLLSSQGTIGDLIFNSGNVFNFYSNQYMRFEIVSIGKSCSKYQS